MLAGRRGVGFLRGWRRRVFWVPGDILHGMSERSFGGFVIPKLKYTVRVCGIQRLA